MKQLKICIFILFALSFLTFTLTFLVFSRRENERAKRIEAEARLNELQTVQDRLKESYDSAKKELSDTEEKLNEEVRRSRELEQELVLEKREKEQLVGQVSTLTADLDALNKDYEEVRSKYEDLAKIVKGLKVKFEEYKRRKTPEPVELPTVVVKPSDQVEGQILVINDVFRFAVVNLGKEDGLAEDMYLDVVRDNGSVARLQVERLYDSLAACSIIRQDEAAPVKVHDVVRAV